MMWRVQTTAHAVRFWALIQLGAICLLLVAVAVLALYAIQTHDSLCKFKRDLQVRHDTTAAFVTAIETGTRPPIAGISLADLKRTERAQQATLDSLDNLDCEGVNWP